MRQISQMCVCEAELRAEVKKERDGRNNGDIQNRNRVSAREWTVLSTDEPLKGFESVSVMFKAFKKEHRQP